MVAPKDAKARRLVRCPDGTEGRLVHAPPPIGEPHRTPPHIGRGAARGRRAVVLVGGRHFRFDADTLELIEPGS
jgi:hypothetical protein